MRVVVSGIEKALVLAVTVLLTVWGVFGFIESRGRGWGGYVYSPEYIVEGIEPGGAAEAAGLEAGDRVVSIEGTPAEELPLYSRWPRSLHRAPGEILHIEVERAGERMPVEIVYADRGLNRLALGVGVIGLVFMLCGLWSLFAAGTTHARALSRTGLACGLALIAAGGPSLGTWDGVLSHISFASGVLWSILMMRFFITFPLPKRIAGSRTATSITYGALLVFVACLVVELARHPVYYHTFGPFGSLLVMIYSTLALAALIHTIIRTPRAVLKDTGMNFILAGLIAGVVPAVVGFIGFALRLVIPGSNYYPLALVLLPVSMALAVRKESSAG